MFSAETHSLEILSIETSAQNIQITEIFDTDEKKSCQSLVRMPCIDTMPCNDTMPCIDTMSCIDRMQEFDMKDIQIVGIYNTGNSCFFNSVMVMLCATNTMHNLIKKK